MQDVRCGSAGARAAFAAVGILGVCGMGGGTAQAQNYLLMPDSGSDRILQLSATDGTILNNDFIVDSEFLTPVAAIYAPTRNTILVSDQLLDSVREYNLDGSFVGTLVGAAQNLDNVRGIAVRDNALYVTVGGGTLSGTIQRFDLTSLAQTTWANVNNQIAGASPFDVFFRDNDVLVSDITGDDILRYDLNGAFLNTYVESNGTTGIDFPQQLARRASNGNILAGGFSPPAGVYEYSGATTGTLVSGAPYRTNLAIRGVYGLANGQTLYTGGTVYGRLNTSANTDTVLVNTAGRSFRYISPVTLAPSIAPEPSTLALVIVGMILPLVVSCRRRRTT